MAKHYTSRYIKKLFGDNDKQHCEFREDFITMNIKQLSMKYKISYRSLCYYILKNKNNMIFFKCAECNSTFRGDHNTTECIYCKSKKIKRLFNQ